MNKKAIAAAVLGIVAAISLIYGITASPKKKSFKTSESDISKNLRTEEAAKDSAVSAKRMASRTSFKSWRRSPFVPPGSGATTSALVLNGIIGHKDKPKAMINDSLVSIGDKIGNYTVLSIKSKSVILTDGNGNIELKMEQ